MDEIITNDSVATASCLGFGVQDETMDAIVDMDNELDNAEEEEEREEEKAEAEPEPALKARKKKHAPNARRAEPRFKWMSKEDECFAEAWQTVSINLITGANENIDTYWGTIKTMFDERKLVDPDFANIHMDCDDKAMANHCATIQMTCNKWHAIIEEVAAHPKAAPTSRAT
ncbi:putative methionyl-tRNA synthetase [Hordeum vulgare]|nr:putative methionyl-tRNA synthetase [Hordeum vulgare]